MNFDRTALATKVSSIVTLYPSTVALLSLIISEQFCGNLLSMKSEKAPRTIQEYLVQAIMITIRSGIFCHPSYHIRHTINPPTP